MLKELVKERLMAAADEIFGLFERTIESYEEELCRTREENERQRRQLEAVGKTHIEDVQQPPRVKKEEEEFWTAGEGEHLLGSEEADLTKLPLTVVSVKTEDHEDKPQAGNLLAPLSDGDDTRETFSSDTDSGGDMRACTDKKHSECSKKKTGKNRLTCSVCAKRFPKKGDLTRHMLTHTGEKPFICSVCGKSFHQKSNIITHMRTHTGEKPFVCSVCGVKFAQRSTLKKHMKTHTGEKPFSCSVCGKRFPHKYTMVSHMRTHTGEKPFSCSVCGERFSQRANMVKHRKTHTGEKAFSCSVCGKGYSYKKGLTAHMLTHNGE
ncbi:gastrula zinc finger protein XlCGF8.2DB-like [Dunckerocampus dactyliophorus]|uniref:gastrula zinc finger protein XlCGF8.2DB-like n=1 Tax=Dunckerocampus dactyliophorus TaxID=161453 RepID=UPI0024062FB5|nr:gastrula zinc finger protein XlCGF8.2DB-like [Dunckerocampus dactyliophorus]